LGTPRAVAGIHVTAVAVSAVDLLVLAAAVGLHPGVTVYIGALVAVVQMLMLETDEPFRSVRSR